MLYLCVKTPFYYVRDKIFSVEFVKHINEFLIQERGGGDRANLDGMVFEFLLLTRDKKEKFLRDHKEDWKMFSPGTVKDIRSKSTCEVAEQTNIVREKCVEAMREIYVNFERIGLNIKSYCSAEFANVGGGVLFAENVCSWKAFILSNDMLGGFNEILPDDVKERQRALIGRSNMPGVDLQQLGNQYLKNVHDGLNDIQDRLILQDVFTKDKIANLQDNGTCLSDNEKKAIKEIVVPLMRVVRDKLCEQYKDGGGEEKKQVKKSCQVLQKSWEEMPAWLRGGQEAKVEVKKHTEVTTTVTETEELQFCLTGDGMGEMEDTEE
ncbi:hypothetical protein [Candidatus Sneabacter namystus]|uniref:Uncharacterized protein n=1 Tax=Candidatus Sneabacter namystus TaxID=2601646 RepID=A0A5C0UH16_9RICK|nr:hypothetical protein [Candidatus Sneabacter namystus]QEK39425.1 hypothetical protein FZC37_00515 [Candidatus Sneabacter namystus]